MQSNRYKKQDFYRDFTSLTNSLRFLKLLHRIFCNNSNCQKKRIQNLFGGKNEKIYINNYVRIGIFYRYRKYY